MPRNVHIIPHTHWDREWYRTFQSFRMELVDLGDEVLRLLEDDPDYRHFMLDGQMAAVDDYLEIRPSNLARLGRLAEAGRLVMGPWYILMDEFGVSGETIVRNLAMGLDRADDFGGAMAVGYLPDMFGHIGQMPQILDQFGFADAVVWRGVPAEYTEAPAFEWVAPDGSSVHAQYLPWGYGNGVGLPPDAPALIRRAELFCARAGNAAGTDDAPVLFMHGTDHRHPIPELPDMVAEANASQDDWHFEISTLADYIAEQRATQTPAKTWQGELRSGARANLLMGVTSNRVDVKIAAARAERSLERLAEPLCALFSPPEAWPAAFLAQAWRRMVHNSAHDSICACSHDDVVLAVLDRFAEAQAIAEGLVERAKLAAYRLGAPAFTDPSVPGAIVVNPTARTRAGLVEVRVPEGPAPEGTQELWHLPARLPFVTRHGAAAVEFFGVIDDQLGDVHEVTLTPTDSGLDIDLHVDPRRFGLLDPTRPRATLEQFVAEHPDRPVRFFYVTEPEHRVLAHVDAVPGFGWKAWRPGAVQTSVRVDDDGRGMANDVVAVRLDDDGTFSVNGHGGLGLLVDEGDRGDTYNFCPTADGVVSRGLSDTTIETLEAGPLRARLQLTGTAHWPERALGEERIGDVPVRVVTEIELRAGEDLVRVAVHLDNHTRDHRLRAWFPLPEATATSTAECAFGVVERGLDAEGGPSEPALPTFPSRRFVVAGGLCVAHEGLNEYELVDIAGEGPDRRAAQLAVTLLRATDMLSQLPMPTRPLPAGPLVRAPGAQVQGEHTFRYAVHVGDADPFAIADAAFIDLQVAGVHVPGTGTPAPSGGAAAPEEGALLEISGAEVAAVHRLDDDPEVLEVRVFNPTASTTTVQLPGRSGHLVDLRGEGDEAFADSFELRPWGIQTVHLDR